MLDLYVVAGAALLFAVWLRLHSYVLIRDGLTIAAVLFLAYLTVAAALE